MPIAMHREKRHYSEEVTFNLTPMIDMTFLLLIFFMVTARLTDQKVSVPLELPVASAAREPKTIENREIVNIDGAGNYYVGDQPVTEGELKAFLVERFRNHPPVRVYLRADAGVRSELTSKVVEMATEAGVQDLIIGTLQKRD